MANGLTTPLTVTGSLTPESALVKNADGSAIASPVYKACSYDSASGKWLCANDAPAGTYPAGAQQFRLQGSSPLVTALSQNGATVAGTAAATQLAAPTGLASTATNATTVGASWNSVANATGYRLQRATDAAFTQGLALVYSGTGTSYVNTGLTASTSYYYRVLAESSGAYSNSDYSAGAGVTTPAASTATRRLLLGTGDSTMRDTNTAGATSGYTGNTGLGWWDDMVSRLALDATWDTVNLGYAGKSPQWVAQNKLSELLSYLDPSKYTQIVVVEGFIGGNGITSQFSRTPAQEVADLKYLAQQAKAAAPGITKVVVLPYLNRTDSPYATSTQDADRQAVNSGVQSDTSTDFDQKPLASSQQQVFQSTYPALTAYCYDQVHPTGSGGANGKGGSGVVAEMAAQGVVLAAGLNGLSNPTYRANLDFTGSASKTITWGDLRNQQVDSGQLHASSDTYMSTVKHGWENGGSSLEAFGDIAASSGLVGTIDYQFQAASGPAGGWMFGIDYHKPSYNAENNSDSNAFYGQQLFAVYRDESYFRCFDAGSNVQQEALGSGTNTTQIRIDKTAAGQYTVTRYHNGNIAKQETGVSLQFPLFARVSFSTAGGYPQGGYVQGVTIAATNPVASGF